MQPVELIALVIGLGSTVFAWLVVTRRPPPAATIASPLDYDRAFSLDAEDLAEQGLKQGYESLLPELRRYCAEPWQVEEQFDGDATYCVSADGREYRIQEPAVGTVETWARATFALFDIVNRQLSHVEQRLYAINGGNDLFGMFLTPRQVEEARRALPRKSDWPYLPTQEPPWYGEFR